MILRIAQKITPVVYYVIIDTRHETGGATEKRIFMKKNTKPRRRPAAPKPAPVSPYPTEWYFMHTGDCSVQDIKAAFAVPGGPDVEVWNELGVVELTLPDKSYVDFQAVPCDLEDEASNAFLAEHRVRTLYWVTVEPVCNESGLAFLQEAANRLGGRFCADTKNFEPVVTPRGTDAG